MAGSPATRRLNSSVSICRCCESSYRKRSLVADPQARTVHYPLSPYSEKIRLALGLKGVSWNSVDIPVWTPRPKLTPMTGGYRRTPILQIGAEFYCDTLHILRAIEELGSSGSLYPKGQEGLAKALGWWIEKGSFMNAVCLTIGNMPGLPQELIEERRPLMGWSGRAPAPPAS